MKLDFSRVFLKKLVLFKRTYEITDLTETWKYFLMDESLPQKYKDHQLDGNMKGCREYHLYTDWLIVYKIIEDTAFMVDMGTHRDVFPNRFK